MTRAPHSQARSTGRGLSLIEMMCVLAMVGVLMGHAVPMLKDLLASQALQATAALLESDILLARSHASASSQPVRLSVQMLPDAGSCYVIHTGAAHACRCTGGGQTVCEDGARALRVEEQRHASGITLAPAERSMLFDPVKGTVTPTATIRVLDNGGRVIHQVVNIMGRVRSCAPAGPIGGLRACA